MIVRIWFCQPVWFLSASNKFLIVRNWLKKTCSSESERKFFDSQNLVEMTDDDLNFLIDKFRAKMFWLSDFWLSEIEKNLFGSQNLVENNLIGRIWKEIIWLSESRKHLEIKNFNNNKFQNLIKFTNFNKINLDGKGVGW